MTAAPPQAPPLRRTPAPLRWSVRTAALGALVLAGWLAWSSVGWGPLTVDHVTTDGGRRLDVTWISGQCDERHEIDVAETADAVTVTVRRQVSRRLCPAIAVPWTDAVRLDAPLGGRTVLDGTCPATQGTAVPRGCAVDVRYR